MPKRRERQVPETGGRRYAHVAFRLEGARVRCTRCGEQMQNDRRTRRKHRRGCPAAS